MKKYIVILLIIPFIFSHCTTTVHTTAQVRYDNPAPPPPPIAPSGYEMFYHEMSAYGRWIDFPGEGYAWAPDVDADFRPYATNGHWVYSNYGWAWVSGYSWGWAAFHYGRWLYQDGYGWLWFPGHEWAPAWVTWGNSGTYYGWAPLAPHINMTASMGGGGWNPPPHYWNFVPKEHITRENVNNYVVNRNTNVTDVSNITKNVTIINNNTTINNTVNNTTINNTVNNSSTVNNHINYTSVYNGGPQVKEVENFTNNKVNQVTINTASKPGTGLVAGNNLSLYRPQIKQPDPVATNRPVPPKVEAYKAPVVTSFADEKKPSLQPTSQPVVRQKQTEPVVLPTPAIKTITAQPFVAHKNNVIASTVASTPVKTNTPAAGKKQAAPVAIAKTPVNHPEKSGTQPPPAAPANKQTTKKIPVVNQKPPVDTLKKH